MRKVVINRYGISEIQETTLLSEEEWKAVRQVCPKHKSVWWWLRSPSYESCRAAIVDSAGSVFNFGSVVYVDDIGIRPAFKLDLEAGIGEKIFVERTLCTVIDKNYALSDAVICSHRFDIETNNFEESEIKRFINSEEFKKKLQ